MDINNTQTNFTQLAQQVTAHNTPLDDNVGIKHWWMAQDNEITFIKEDSHTLSFYISGGKNNFRKDRRHVTGCPGRFCFMAQQQISQWQINQQVEFVHLYFSDRLLQHYATTSLGMDVRHIDLQDLTFVQDARLQQFFSNDLMLMKQQSYCSPLFVEQAVNDVMHHLLLTYNATHIKPVAAKGGLSPSNMRQVRDLVQAHLGDKLSIEQLSSSLNLSPFHFARMFKLSFGESPASYITRSRICAIKQKLTGQDSLSLISQEMGFSHQSHMSQSFKKLTGLTPAQYKSLLAS